MARKLLLADREAELNRLVKAIRNIEGCELFWEVHFSGGGVQLRPTASVLAGGQYWERAGAWCGSTSYKPVLLCEQLVIWLRELETWARLKKHFQDEDDEELVNYFDLSSPTFGKPLQ